MSAIGTNCDPFWSIFCPPEAVEELPPEDGVIMEDPEVSLEDLDYDEEIPEP